MAVPLALSVAGPAVRAQRWSLGAAGGLAVLRVGTTLARPWPLALAVDYAIDGRRSTGILGWLNGVPAGGLLAIAGALLIGLSGLAGLCDMGSTMYAERAAERIGADLRQTVFDHAMTLSLRWHDRIRSGELLSRLTTDVGRMLDAVVAATADLVPDVVMLGGVLVVLVGFDPALALVGLAVVPVLAVLAVRQRTLVRAVQQEARAASGRLTGATTDLLRNVRAVQAFARADRATAVFGHRNRALLDVELRAVDTEARWTPVADLVLAVGSGMVLAVGGRQVLAGRLSTGDLLVVMSYLGNLYSPVRGLTRLSTVLAKASASAARVREVLGCVESVTDAPDARPAPALAEGVRFERVRFGYEPGRLVLHDFDLHIRAGETVCLLGPSGAGKSTILHLLLRLYDVDGGHVLLDGVDIRTCQQRSVRERMAFVPQDPWLLDATLAENIAFGSRTATRAGVLAAGSAALVDEFAHRLPAGYDTSLGEGGARLSGGQRRRVALARAAVSNAPMMLLDEPTASLDPESAAAVMRAIRSATVDRTVLIVTHDRELAAIADRAVVLDRHPAPQGTGSPHPSTDRKEVHT
ncbi:MAG TPA: ABC transporter ATP-binding protein [Mycobacteriales bacterium]|nr:ABC transporter ATP-binding protein [Mycobacteriales bacterium]